MGVVTVLVGNSGAEAPQVHVADALQQLAPRQDEFSVLMAAGYLEEALALQRDVIETLEGVEDLDSRGYATAYVRRLRRVVERLEEQHISATQARLMVGETLQRADSGDLEGVESPAGTPATTPRARPMRSPAATAEISMPEPSAFGFEIPPVTPDIFMPPSPDLSPSIPSAFSAPTFSGYSSHSQGSLQPSPQQSGMLTPRMIPRRHPWRVGRFDHNTPAQSSQSITPEPRMLTLATPPTSPHMNVLSEPAYLLTMSATDQASLPSEFFCPITQDIMTDPVVAEDGHTYERAAIEHWYGAGNTTSPKTSEHLTSYALIANHAIRAQITTENDRRERIAAETSAKSVQVTKKNKMPSPKSS